MSDFTPISDLLASALPAAEEHPVGEPEQSRLQLCWTECLGEAGLYSQPLLFNTGLLVVYCESPVWGSEIRHQSRRLQEMLVERKFDVESIQVRVRPWQKPRIRPRN